MHEPCSEGRVRSRLLLAAVPVAVLALVFAGSLAYFRLTDGDASADEPTRAAVAADGAGAPRPVR